MIEPAVVVIAYNREKPLLRLLKSLEDASYPSSKITLHISIDASPNTNVKSLADDFTWTHGEKIVELKEENLGLLNHVLMCGELTEKYDSIIVLEDDLIVAPGFYNYAQKANHFYTNDAKVAGVSLFTYPVDEKNFYPFQPIQDDSDVHFIQLASSWGQSWSKDQWSKFTAWLKENPQGKETQLPDYIMDWGTNSWKKLFINYLIDTDRYFVFPTTSYSSNFEEVGTHSTQTGLFQVPLKLGTSDPRLKNWSESNSIYDAYFELTSAALKKMAPQFAQFDLEVDLYGQKPISSITSKYLLTIRKGKSPILQFGATMQPLIQNIIFEIPGNEITLIDKETIVDHQEPDRFTQISKSIVTLRQNARTFNAHEEQITVVIPAMDQDRLQHTFDNLYKDRFYNVTILVSCHPHLSRKFEGLEESVGCRIRWVLPESTDLNELLHLGFSKCTTNYVSWVQAGMEINLKKFEDVTKVFSGMKQVNFLRGIDDEVSANNYLTKSSARWRITPQLAYACVNGSGNISSELMVWRRSTMDEINPSLKDDFSNLFIELLKNTPLYVLMDQIGSRNGVESIHTLSKKELRECLKEPRFKRNFLKRFTTHPYLYPAFYANVPFIRFFYKEIGRFPLVIRHDFKNKSYFLDNY